MQNDLQFDLEHDLITSAYRGTQTAASIDEITKASLPYIQQLRAAKKPVRFLLDVRGIEGQDSGARKAAIDGINTLDYDKMAIFGAPLVIKYVTMFLIENAHKQEKVKYFDTEGEARQWLNSTT